MSRLGELGEIVHWYEVWQRPIDLWCRVCDPDGRQVEVIAGSVTIKGITWDERSRPHILPSEHSVKSRFVPEDEVPDDVWAAIAKRALLGSE